MPKYYRVRNQEQWDWLMQRFEKHGITWCGGEKPTEFYVPNALAEDKAIYLDGDQLTWGTAEYALWSGHSLIEVSNLMGAVEMQKEGCEYCKQGAPLNSSAYSDFYIHVFDESDLAVEFDDQNYAYCPISYCPMCGKKLQEVER